jgi:hypothetical protein
MAKKTRKGGEYRMLIQPTYDETLKKAGTLFLIETVKQFSSFSYEVVVEETREEKQLTWALHGLRAPELLMPSFGGAQFKKIYFDLKGIQTFILKKIDGEMNEFKLKISPAFRCRSDYRRYTVCFGLHNGSLVRGTTSKGDGNSKT